MRHDSVIIPTTRKADNRRRWLGILTRVAIVFVPAFLLCLTRLDPDFGWHLQAGNYIRANGIPSYDIFSYTAPSFRWIDHEWGSDVILSYIYQLGGYTLAAVVTALLWAGALLLAAGRRAHPALLFLATLAASPFIMVRPTVVTILFLAFCLAILRRGPSRLYWLLPPLFLIWANLHAGFISGLALIGYFMLVRRSKYLLYIGLVCFAATFANAYGYRIYEEIIRTLFSTQLRSHVQEWKSFNILAATRVYIALWIAGFVLYDRKRLRNWIGLGPLLLAASVSAVRNLPLFVLVTLHDMDRYVHATLKRLPRKLGMVRTAAIGIVVLLLVLIQYANIESTVQAMSSPRERTYPAAAAAYLRQHPCPGNVYNNYNYGGYLIWQLPGSKVYIDGRMPSWDVYMAAYVSLRDNPAEKYQVEFTKHTIKCAVLANGGDKKFITVLQKAGWQTVTTTDAKSTLLLAPEVKKQ